MKVLSESMTALRLPGGFGTRLQPCRAPLPGRPEAYWFARDVNSPGVYE